MWNDSANIGKKVSELVLWDRHQGRVQHHAASLPEKGAAFERCEVSPVSKAMQEKHRPPIAWKSHRVPWLWKGTHGHPEAQALQQQILEREKDHKAMQLWLGWRNVLDTVVEPVVVREKHVPFVWK